ncbi:arylsulfatase [Gimesia aquarii]|uniref:Arylsulfatase n=1 Tax=Gimesia aquarii TaxID=2527964 RepID=A0A517VQC9_9PLAN|nr:arylsulfatase [Gimesia aquarii]QDT95212.1 Arylsulfatase [Gimesia aquarii]
MTRFVKLILCSLLLLCVLLTSTSNTEAASKQLPNIVFIIADDLGYKELGCYGQKWIQTPNIDKIAKNGIRFTQFYSGNAVCAPSRCNLLTGKHPGHAYIRDNRNPKHLQHMKEKEGWEFPGQYPIPDAEVTIAEMLKQKNYATGAMGKWGLGHFGTTGDPNRQGFDLFYGFNCQVHAHNHYPKFLWRNNTKETLPGNDRTLYGDTHSQDKFVENGLAFIREHQDQPFFLYLPFAIPHLSIQTTEASLAKYRGKIPEEEYKHRGYIKHPHPRAGYAGMITQMDDGVGQIMALLKELKLEDNTIVFFTSDNGPTYNRLGGSDSKFFESAGPYRGFKGSLYEGGIRVPLVVQWPGHIQPGEVTDHLSAFWDVMPTLADLTGTKAPADIDGISFLPTLLGKEQQQKQHEYLYWEFPSYTGQQAVHMGDWKGVRQKLMRKKNPQMKIELYNLKDDPGEKHNVADQHPEVVARIKEIMKTGRSPSEMFPFPALDQQ